MDPHLSEKRAAGGATAELIVMKCIKKKPQPVSCEAFLAYNRHVGVREWEVMVCALLSPAKCFLNQGGKW